jgi:hypothetical protein
MQLKRKKSYKKVARKGKAFKALRTSKIPRRGSRY